MKDERKTPGWMVGRFVFWGRGRGEASCRLALPFETPANSANNTMISSSSLYVVAHVERLFPVLANYFNLRNFTAFFAKRTIQIVGVMQ